MKFNLEIFDFQEIVYEEQNQIIKELASVIYRHYLENMYAMQWVFEGEDPGDSGGVEDNQIQGIEDEQC